MSWIILLKSRDEFFDVFKLWLLKAEVYGNKLDFLQTNGGGEFISAVFLSFCKKQGIKIAYTALYMHKKTEIAQRCCRTLI